MDRLRATKERPVRSCWAIARIESVGRLLGTEFEPRGLERLAALVLETPDQLVFDEHPAKDDPPKSWRAGDGGVFAPDGFELLFVLHDSDSKELDLGVSMACRRRQLPNCPQGSGLTLRRNQARLPLSGADVVRRPRAFRPASVPPRSSAPWEPKASAGSRRVGDVQTRRGYWVSAA